MQRRQFIKQGGATTLGLLFLPGFARKVVASDRIRLAIIGVGGMGNQHLKWFAALPEVEIVALCDVDKDHMDRSLKTLSSLQPQSKAVGYGDFRHVLDRKDIDAVSCATPDHWHAQIATLAFEAGKDVYGEKPLSYDIGEGQRMLKALNRHKRVFQMGNQIHAGDNFHRVVEIIQSGALGKVHTVRLWKTGAPPDLGPAQIQAPPPSLNWDMWLGPAPYTEYTPQRCHVTYRYFLDYSGGVFADFWCHIADVVYWSLDPKGLKTIEARGQASQGINDAPQWMDVDYEFDDLKLYWTHEAPAVPGAAGRGIGAYFEGENGTLLCDYNSRLITINGETVQDLPNLPVTLERSPGHQQNFVNAIKARTQPESNLEYARRMTIPMHLGLISYRLGRKLNWDSNKEKFVDDKEANGLLHREYRKKWDLL
ncbi:MAG TPA: Gfo/Idh/MocA family oxidoreductase [Flavisolibacter sp.]|jgi:predicted dehydrogenase|nr:Gfo/Idh/MocA family oxidoreductase [Flavisolibacter sp.]